VGAVGAVARMGAAMGAVIIGYVVGAIGAISAIA